MMNVLSKKVLLALGFLSFGGSALGYTWTFTNVTNKVLLVQVILAGWYNVDMHLGVYLNVVKPGENSDFSWGLGNPRVGHCLSSIRVAEFNENIMGSVMYQKGLRNDRSIYDDFSANGGQARMLRHPLREVDIVFLQDRLWGMFDQKAQKAAAELTGVVAGALGEAAKLAIAAGVTAGTGGAAAPIVGAAGAAGTAGAAGVASMAGTVAKGAGSMLDFSPIFKALGGITQPFMELMRRSKCTGRHFDIVESKDSGLTLVTKEK
jgi:hypothetical protein